jgi:hypothetical protein
MEPAMYALLPARWHSSRATSGVSFVSAGRVISRNVAARVLSGRRFRNGDCRSETPSAVFRVENRVAGAVCEIGEHDRVFFAQRL